MAFEGESYGYEGSAGKSRVLIGGQGEGEVLYWFFLTQYLDNTERRDMITIVDAVMGSGKSSYIIDQLNTPQSQQGKYVILLPSLTEVVRYKENLSRDYSGNRTDIVALDTKESDTKADRFRKAVSEGKTVIMTHRLFSRTSAEDLQAFSNIKDYELVIDETITLVGKKTIQSTDLKALVAEGYMETVDHSSIEGLKYYKLLPRGEDYIDDGGQDRRDTIWSVSGKHVYQVDKQRVVFIVPPDKLEAFKGVAILTYLFEGSETEAWLKLFGLPYDHQSLVFDPLTDRAKGTMAFSGNYGGSQFRNLLFIFNHKINDIGAKKPRDKGEPLSKSWFIGQKPKGAGVKKLSNNTRTFFVTHMKVDKADIMWTCFKDHRKWVATSHFDPKRKKVGGKYVDLAKEEEAFVSQTTRGTNDYSGRHCLAFLVNVNPYPELVTLFKNHKIIFDVENYALSRLVQWTWRSAIRKGEAVILYLPSKRMRGLLEEWLNK